MKLRSNCKCDCHNHNYLTLHEQPCCIEVPTIEELWSQLKNHLIKEKLPEEIINFLRGVFYSGAAGVISNLAFISVLDSNESLQMINEMYKEVVSDIIVKGS